MKRLGWARGSVGFLVQIVMLENAAPGLAYKRTSSIRGTGRILAVGLTPTAKASSITQKGEAKRVKNKEKSSVDPGFSGGPLDEDEGDNIFDLKPTTQIESEDAFIEYCQSDLLSIGAASHGLISQVDVEEFLSGVCKWFDPKSIPHFSCPAPQFASLNVQVQLSFVSFVCPNEDQTSTRECLTNLGLGDLITGDDYQSGEDSVLGLCCSLLPFLGNTGITPLGSNDCTSVPVTDLSNPASDALPGRQPTTEPILSPAPMPTPSPTTTLAVEPNNVSGGSPARQSTGEPIASSKEQMIMVVQGQQAVESPTTLTVWDTVGIVLGSAAFLVGVALIFTEWKTKAEQSEKWSEGTTTPLQS